MNLEDSSRTVEVVPAPSGVAWDAVGDARDADYWLGSASDHDRAAIRALAGEIGPGRALRITFLSVMTFILYRSRTGRFLCYVPGGDDALRAQGIEPDPKPVIAVGDLPPSDDEEDEGGSRNRRTEGERRMTLEEIRQLSAYRLAEGFAGVHAPDSETSAGAVFMYAVRDWYLSYRDVVMHAEFPKDVIAAARVGESTNSGDGIPGAVTDITHEAWETFTDLQLYTESWDEGLFRVDVNDLTDTLVNVCLGEIAERTVSALWNADDKNEQEEQHD